MNESIFPLPATPFELYYLLDDRPGYPTVFPIRMALRGSIDRADFDRALALAVQRHPLVAARVELQADGRAGWAPGEPPRIAWLDPLAYQQFSGSADNMLAKRTLAIAACAGDEATTVTLLFQHSAVDGLAGFQFIEDWLVAYDHLRAGGQGEPAWRPLDAGRLRTRDEYGLRDYKPTLLDALNTLRFWTPLVFKRAASLAPRSAGVGSDRAPLDYATHWLSVDESKSLARLARQQGVTLNDLLLRDFFVTLSRWNEQSPGRRLPLRVLVPTNLRHPDDAATPAANILSFAFLTHKPGEAANPERLLRSIQQKTALIKRWRLGLFFVGGLKIASNWPRLLRRLLYRRWTFATAVFSNLGPVFPLTPLQRQDGQLVAGNAVLVKVDGVAPIRPGTPLSAVVINYAGCLGVFFRCDPTLFDAAGQAQLLAAFVAQVRSTLASEPRVAQPDEAATTSA